MKKIIYYVILFIIIFASLFYIKPFSPKYIQIKHNLYRIDSKNVQNNFPADFRIIGHNYIFEHAGDDDINYTTGLVKFKRFTYYGKVKLEFMNVIGKTKKGKIEVLVYKNNKFINKFLMDDTKRYNKVIYIPIKHNDTVKIKTKRIGNFNDIGIKFTFFKESLLDYRYILYSLVWFAFILFLEKKGYKYIAYLSYILFVIILYAEKTSLGYLKIYNFLFYMLFIILIIKIFIIINKLKIKKSIKWFAFTIMLSPLLIISSILIIYNINFGEKLNKDMIYPIFQTNISEGLNFILDFISFKSILVATIILILVWFILKLQNRQNTQKIDKYFLYYNIVFIIAVLFAINSEHKESFRVIDFFIDTKNQYIKNIETFQKLQEMRNKKISDFNASKVEKGETYVVIIGESLNKRHMGLYGYFRNTTPNLSKLYQNGEILKFNNIYSCHTATIDVLARALTQANQKNKKDYYDSLSIMNILNKSGFETHWFTSQRSYGIYDNVFTAIAKTADDFKPAGVIRYDEKLLPKLKNVLKRKTNKNRIIFLHLFGNHWTYSDRYPKKYNYYKKALTIGEIGEEGIKRNNINQYDNSVLYNDYVVSSVIKELKKIKGVAGLIYMPDHSEDVLRGRAHTPAHFTYDMTQIPIIMWFNSKYKNRYKDKYKNLRKHINTLFCNDMLYDTIIDITNIKTKYYNKQNALSNKNYYFPPDKAKTLYDKYFYTSDKNFLYWQELNSRLLKQKGIINNLAANNIHSLAMLSQALELGFTKLSSNIKFKDNKIYIYNNDINSELTLDKYLNYANSKNKKINFIFLVKDIKPKDIDKFIKKLEQLNNKYSIRNRIILVITNKKFLNNKYNYKFAYDLTKRDFDLKELNKLDTKYLFVNNDLNASKINNSKYIFIKNTKFLLGDKNLVSKIDDKDNKNIKLINYKTIY